MNGMRTPPARRIAFALLAVLLVPAAAAQPVTLTTDDIDLKNGTVTNASRIYDFFDAACPSSEAVQRIHPNGTYTCVSVSGGTGQDVYVNESGDVMSGTLNMNGSTITGVGTLNLQTVLNDTNVSDALTVSSSGSVNTTALNGVITNNVNTGFLTTTDPLTDGNISNTLTITGGSVDKGVLNNAGTLSFEWQDGEVANSITVDAGGISGTITNDIDTGFLTTGTPLTAGNISSDAITGTELASNAVTAGGGHLDTSVAGPGIGLSGGALNVSTGTGLTLSSDAVTIDTGVVPRKGQTETVTGYWTFDNNMTVTGDLNVLGNITNTDVENLNVNGSIVPPDPYDATFDLGTGQLRWRDAFISRNIYVNGTVQAATIEQGGSTLDSLYINVDGDTMTGPLDMGRNSITNLSAISVNNPLTDGNVSDTITVGSGGSVDTGALSGVVTNDVDTAFLTTSDPLADGNVSDAISISSSGSVAAGAVSGTLSDGQVTDALTVSSSGSVDTGALSGTVTNNIDTGHFTTSDPLADGNISNSITIGSSGSVDPAALSSAVAVSEGGTGASTASGARSNLGAAGVGDCGPGQVVANTTSSGTECVTVDTGAGTDYGALVNRSGGAANSMTGLLDLGGNALEDAGGTNITGTGTVEVAGNVSLENNSVTGVKRVEMGNGHELVRSGDTLCLGDQCNG